MDRLMMGAAGGLALAILVAGCGTTTTGPRALDGAAGPGDATPRAVPPSRYGNPASYEVFGRTYHVLPTSEGYRRLGVASWYGEPFHGRRTSSGETSDMHTMTAAHKSLPIPTWVRVTRTDTGRSIVVKVNDRGPFVDDRIIDLSLAAATRLGMVEQGTVPVEVHALPPYQRLAGPRRTLAAARPPQVEPASRRSAWLQLGAFSDRRLAEALRTRLHAYDAGTIVIDSDAGDLYRVRIGPLPGPDEALRLAQRLSSSGLPDGHLVYDHAGGS